MQDSLLIKLFVARILTSTVFSYIALKWSNFLDPSTIASVINIQIGASITAPLIAVLDLPGVFNRHIMPILFPLQTQNELNSCYFSGSAWLLAERYTGLGKVIFVALLFAILTPSGLFLASGACILIYWLDRYLIFRRWARVPMFDGQLGKRVSRACPMLLFAGHLQKVSLSIGYTFVCLHYSSGNKYYLLFHATCMSPCCLYMDGHLIQL